MGISKEQLAAIIGGKARDLCSPQGDAMINEARRLNRDAGYVDEDPANYDGDADYYDSMYTSEVEAPTRRRKVGDRDIQYTEAGVANSRLDEKIKKSMVNNPIDRSGMYGGDSVLDDMNIPAPKPRRMVNENYQRPQNVGGVDYSIIKAIVNECLNEYFSKQPLNEGATLSTIGLKKGSIKLVDSKGNVFTANLKHIGNTNDVNN